MSQIDIRFFSQSLNRYASFKMYIPDDKRNYGGVYDKQNMKTLFILHGYTQDGNNWMEIDDLAKGLPDDLFDFILFDACYMASVECTY